MTGKGACVACRIRKVKCVQGPAHHCERCAAQGIKDCIYEGVKKRGIGQTLRMREACIRCRTRKRKCDAKRPCTTCVEADNALECAYKVIDTRPHLPDHTRFTFLIQPIPSSSTNDTTQEHSPVEKVVRPVPTDRTSVASGTRPIPESVPPASALLHSLGRNSQPVFPPPEPRTHFLNQVRVRDPQIPRRLSVLPTLIFPSIPPEPHITLSFLGAEHFQLSDVARSQLDLKFRLNIICRLGKLGIRFSPGKQKALLRGDMSGTAIHPFFIPAAHSLGMHFCEGMHDSPAMVALHAKYVQKSLELLMEVLKEIADWELQAQVALWITMGSIVMRLSHVTSAYVKKGCETINLGGLRFIPTYGRPPAFSEELHEKLSVLSQIIYFENFHHLAYDGPQPTMTARVEREFRHKLRETYPALFRICPLTMRTQGILLVRDTVVILRIRPAEEVQLDFWRRSCNDLLSDLDNYSRSLLSNLRRFRELGDKSGSGVIQSCCIDCLAHLAVLCEALCQIGPAREDLYILCDSALERLSELTRDVCTEEYTRLDLLLGLSWKKALAVFDSRIANTILEHRTKLRCWRDAVAEVYSDFVAKVPDPEPPILTARARELDGRTEESQYPNLMLPWVQQRYGL